MGKVINLTNSLKTEPVFITVGSLAPIKVNDGRSTIMQAMKVMDAGQDEAAINKTLELLLGKGALAKIEKEIGELSFAGYQELVQTVIAIATGDEGALKGGEFRE